MQQRRLWLQPLLTDSIEGRRSLQARAAAGGEGEAALCSSYCVVVGKECGRQEFCV